jgi:hypothetical protein
MFMLPTLARIRRHPGKPAATETLSRIPHGVLVRPNLQLVRLRSVQLLGLSCGWRARRAQVFVINPEQIESAEHWLSAPTSAAETLELRLGSYAGIQRVPSGEGSLPMAPAVVAAELKLSIPGGSGR